MIDLLEVRPGDQVTIQDANRNLAAGEVGGAEESLHVEAFGVCIVFARMSRQGNLRPVPGLRLVGHLPAMVAAPGRP